MKETNDHIECVIKAQQGNAEATARLTEIAAQRLSQFVYRLTLQEELTQDIVQESLVDMLKFFPTLKHTERFWYWLYSIAYNKLGHHFKRQRLRRSVSLSQLGPEAVAGKHNPTVADAISHELCQIVGKSMQQIDPKHRAILTMRCYDQMSYAEIAQMMQCSVFSARALFYRAKKALARRLAGYGLEKGALLTALIVFGKMTSASKASAAQLTISAATLDVGAGTMLGSFITSKTVAVWLAGTLLTTGTLVRAVRTSQDPPSLSIGNTQSLGLTAPLDSKRWSFYPKGIDGPVMIRTQSQANDRNAQWHILQTPEGNFLWEGRTITFRNAHVLLGDLTLPQPEAMRGQSLLFLEELNPQERLYTLHPTRHQNVLQEDYFKSDWPADIQLVDARDAMRKRGWTYAQLSGTLQGEPLRGTACIPFRYDALTHHKPWLKLTVGDRLVLLDTPRKASLHQTHPSRHMGLRPGSFLQGLNRPWMGLHCVDDVTRCARQQGLTCKILSATATEVDMMIECESVQWVYDIDRDDDLICGIRWYQNNTQIGELQFLFFQEIPAEMHGMSPPQVPSAQRANTSDRLGIRWLAYLGQKRLTDQL